VISVGLCLEVHGRKHFSLRRERDDKITLNLGEYIRPGSMTPCCLVSPLAHAHGFDSFAERKEESRSIGHARRRDDAVLLVNTEQ